MKEEIEFINTLVEKKKQEIETILKWSKKGREEIEKLHSIRLALSEKMDKADELKDIARRILGEEKQEAKFDIDIIATGIKKPEIIGKYCPKCKTEKSTSSFHKDVSRADGLHLYCKDCTRQIQRKYYARKNKKVKENKEEPKGWNIYKQFLDGKWRDTNVMKHLFQKQYPDTRQSVIDVYMARCKRYAEDNLNLTYWSDNKDGQ